MARVLHVITGLTVGGAETALYRLITSSHDSECTHAVVALTPGGTLGHRMREAGIELIDLDFKKSPISNFVILLLIMRRTRPDIVQTWMYHADMLGGLAARISGIRNIIWGIRMAELSGGNTHTIAVIRKACAWLSRWVPHTIVCVAEAARRVHVGAGYDATRMVVVPNGFELSGLGATSEQRKVLRNQCGFDPEELVIGTVGRFDAYKDQQNFVHAAGVLAQCCDKVRFLMVGRNVDPANADLMRWVDQTGYADRFVMLGERTDVPVCLASMDIFCLSSRTEGFPNVVGEAMAMALPCVVTDVGDSAVLVADTGVVVPKEDSGALAQGLASVIRLTPEGRRQMGARARARIQAEFTLEITRKRFEAIYQRLTQEGRR